MLDQVVRIVNRIVSVIVQSDSGAVKNEDVTHIVTGCVISNSHNKVVLAFIAIEPFQESGQKPRVVDPNFLQGNHIELRNDFGQHHLEMRVSQTGFIQSASIERSDSNNSLPVSPPRSDVGSAQIASEPWRSGHRPDEKNRPGCGFDRDEAEPTRP